MELRDYLAILRTRWLIVVATMLVAAIVAGIYLVRATPLYIARASVFFSVAVDQSSGDLARGFSYAQSLAGSYSQVATQPVVLNPVIQDLSLRTTPADLARHVSAQSPVGTVIINISVTEPDPKLAARIANAVAFELTSTVQKLSPNGSGTTASPVQLVQVASAAVPTTASSPRPKTSLVLALGLGLVLGVALALLREAMDRRVHREDVGEVTEAPVLGTLVGSSPSRLRSGRGGAGSDPLEQAIQLRTNFEYLRAERNVRIAAFTSPSEDGANTALVTLTAGLAQAGVRVVLVDGDLRHPSLAQRYGKDDVLGLGSVLTGQTPWRKAIQELDQSGTALLAAGPALDDPSRMLSADAVGGLFKELLDAFDLVLVKCPPVLQVAEGLLLARLADGVVVVAEERSVHRDALADEVEALESVDAGLLGVVLTA